MSEGTRSQWKIWMVFVFLRCGRRSGRLRLWQNSGTVASSGGHMLWSEFTVCMHNSWKTLESPDLDSTPSLQESKKIVKEAKTSVGDVLLLMIKNMLHVVIFERHHSEMFKVLNVVTLLLINCLPLMFEWANFVDKSLPLLPGDKNLTTCCFVNHNCLNLSFVCQAK